MEDNQERRVRPRLSFLRYADPNHIATISPIQTPVRIDSSSESLELKLRGLELKISGLENDIKERDEEKEEMMTEGKRLLGIVQNSDLEYENLKEQAIVQMRSLQTKVEQAEELLADARIDCVSNVAMKEQNDNLKDENLFLNDQIKELTRQKIEFGKKEREAMNDNTSDKIINDLKEDKERMRTDNTKLAKELEKYKPVEGFVCTTPYDRSSTGDRRSEMIGSCTSTTGTPGSFDDVVRNPVNGSRFKKNQPCVNECYTR